MSNSEKQQRRANRKAGELRRRRTKVTQTKEIVRLGENFPNINEFIASLDLSQFGRLLGIFTCSPDDYMATETILEKNGYAGYVTLQAEIDGDITEGGDKKKYGWATVVKHEGDPDEAFKVFVGVVSRQLSGNSDNDDSVSANGWFDIVSVAHELGHAYDMDKGITFHLGQPFVIEDAEVVAHDFTCRLLRERGLIMGLVAYLSSAIISVVQDSNSTIAGAARRFMASDEYRRSVRMIPRHIRQHFGITEACHDE